MGKLRKFLAVFFGCLSALFAIIAVRNRMGAQECLPDCRAPERADWNCSLQAEARKAGKLVFLIKKGENFSPDKRTAEILKTRYITAVIDPESHPADFRILDALLSRRGCANASLKAGILSPRLHPIYLTSRLENRENSSAPSLSDAIVAAAAELDRNENLLKSSASKTAETIDNPKNFSPVMIDTPMVAQLRFLNSESARLFFFFNDPEKLSLPTAIISENARLSMRISGEYIGQISARHAAVIAAEILKNRMAADSPFGAKLLYARALCESDAVLKNGQTRNALMLFADEILLRNSSSESVRDAALSASVLMRVYAITKERKYSERAAQVLERLEKIVTSRGLMPSMPDSPSQASALEYVLCARAFLDMSILDNSEKWRALAKESVRELDEFFMTKIGMWSLNSSNSLLSEFARPVITRDSCEPSYIGEAAQLMPFFGEDFPETAERLRRLAMRSVCTSPLEQDEFSSLKLSFLPDPFDTNAKTAEASSRGARFAEATP